MESCGSVAGTAEKDGSAEEGDKDCPFFSIPIPKPPITQTARQAAMAGMKLRRLCFTGSVT